MGNKKILAFYKELQEQKKLNPKLLNEIKNITNETELENFIEKKIVPIAKDMGYNFSTKELLTYEKNAAKEISTEDLENISGGVNLRGFAAGGIMAFTALAAGIISSTSMASATLTASDVINSTKVVNEAIKDNLVPSDATMKKDQIQQGKKKVDPKAGEKKEIKEESKSDKEKKETLVVSQTQEKKVEPKAGEKKEIKEESKFDKEKKETSVVSQTQEKKVEPKAGEKKEIKEESKSDKEKSVSDSTKDQKNKKQLALAEESSVSTESATPTLPSKSSTENTTPVLLSESSTPKSSTPSDSNDEKTEGKKEKKKKTSAAPTIENNAIELTDEEKNLLKNIGVKETDSLTHKNTSQIIGKNFSQYQYKKDPNNSGKANLLKGILKKIESFKKPNLDKAKEVATTPIAFENLKLKSDQKLYVYKALNLQDAFSLLQSNVIENLRLYGNVSEINLRKEGGRNYIQDKGDAFTKILTMLFPSSAGGLNTVGGGKDTINFSIQTNGKKEIIELIARFCAFLNDYRNGIANSKKDFSSLKDEHKYIENGKVTTTDKTAQDAIEILKMFDIIKPNKSKGGNETYQGISNKKIQLCVSFMKALQDAVNLETSENSSYPKYLTEHILMSYMVKELDNGNEIKELYDNIAIALSKNKSSKMKSKDQKEETIEAEKARLEKLNEVIKAMKVRELSPYKSNAAESDTAYRISEAKTEEKDGKVIFKVKFSNDTFADCVDTATRHTVNLLSYSENKNWDLFLPKDTTQLEEKLHKVIDAINKKEEVEFYDLKTRAQIFFLYQRELQKNEDEKIAAYRSLNGADDTSKLARTLWEYVICNMNNEDTKDNYYKVSYHSENIELNPGYENMLKLMWNIAKSVKGESDQSISDAKNAIDKLPQKDTELYQKNLKNAIALTFKLFNKELENENIISIDLEKGKDLGKVDIIYKDLKFTITHNGCHAFVTHNPISFEWNDNFAKDDYTKDDFTRLLLRAIPESRGKIGVATEFYGLFSGENLEDDDNMMGTDIYKKYKALKAFRDLQGEENNEGRIYEFVTLDVLEGANLIEVENSTVNKSNNPFIENKIIEKKESITLFDVLCEKYLSKICPQSSLLAEIYNNCISNAMLTDNTKLSSSLIFTDLGKGEAKLIINRKKFNEEKLIIPSKIKDKDGKEFNVKKIDKIGSVNLSTLKELEFDEKFEKLDIAHGTFENSSVNTVVLPKKLGVIGAIWFKGCKLLENVSFPENVKVIDENAFEGCISLKSINIPETVTWIGDYAFKDCKSLESIDIPKNIGFGDSVFYNTNIKNIEVKGLKSGNTFNCEVPLFVKNILEKQGINCPKYCLEREDIKRNILDIKDGICFIPEGIKVIGKLCFKNFKKNLKTIIFPSTLEKIEYRAFDGLSVENVIFSEGFEVFNSNINLGGIKAKLIKFPSTLKYLNNFSNITVDELYVPTNSIENIDLNCFYNTTIKTLICNKNIYCYGKIRITPKEKLVLINDNANIEEIDEAQKNAKIYKPYFLEKLEIPIGKNAIAVKIWNNQMNINEGEIVFNLKPIGYTEYTQKKKNKEISENEIYTNFSLIKSDLTKGTVEVKNGELIVPDVITMIGNGCFRANKELKSVTLPSSLKIIAASAFDNTNIENIKVKGLESGDTFNCEVPLFVKNILEKQGIKCPNYCLTHEDIRKSIIEIKDGICEIPDFITTIGKGCFVNEELESIILPSTLKKIEMYAFDVDDDNYIENIEVKGLKSGDTFNCEVPSFIKEILEENGINCPNYFG